MHCFGAITCCRRAVSSTAPVQGPVGGARYAGPMAEPFKNLINPDVLAQMGQHLHRAWPGFDHAGFQAAASTDLDALELKARVMQVAQALVAHLPDDPEPALATLEAALGPPGQGDALDTLRTGPQGLAGWPVWPMTEAVVLIALQRAPERGLATLHAMTQRLTAEFALRPFIVAHPALCWDTLARWAQDPSAHVRRLASEGSRPRLPWGLRLQALVADPSPALPLLRRLQDDPSAYVRRSVANHLNDIAKDHPGLVAQWLAEHLPGATPERRALLRHASRSLIKAGDAAVLAAWGQGQPFQGRVQLVPDRPTVPVGEHLGLQVLLTSTSPQAQTLVLDYAVHHVKAAGHSSPKVFKGWSVELPPGASLTLAKRHSFKPVTVRSYHPGAHVIDLRINGQVLAEATVQLLPGPPAAAQLSLARQPG